MKVLTVSAAKWGIQNAVHSLLAASTRTNVEHIHLTLPIHPTPDGVRRLTLLSERLLNLLDRVRIIYLLYAIYLFWGLTYRHLTRHDEEYDIIWLHSPRLLLLYPRALDSKTIVTVHGLLMHTRAERHTIPEQLYYQLLGTIQRWGIRRHEEIMYTVVHEEIADGLRELGVPSDQIHVIGNGVDIETFKPESTAQTSAQNPSERLTLLWVGRFIELKRPLKTLELFAALRRSIDIPLQLVLVGDGPLRGEAEQLVNERGLDGSVMFRGIVDHEAMPDVYRDADVFMLLSEYEGEPLVLYEAMASGHPSIVSDIPSCRFVESADCGITVDLNVWEQSIDHISQYLNGDLTEQRANARQYAEANLQWSERLTEYHTLFRETVVDN